jgi:hypothetical protein
MKLARFCMAVMTVALVGAVTLQAGPVAAAAGGVPAQVEAVLAQVAALQAQVAALQATVTNQAVQIATLQTQSSNLQNNPVLALGPYVSVNPDGIHNLKGPHIIFTGANVHIRSGGESTDDRGNLLGLGNLVVGYNENYPNNPDPIEPRNGSHNLIIGTYHSYTGCAGFVAGWKNTIGAYSSVCGGQVNIASGDRSSILGGSYNEARGPVSTVSGGFGNHPTGLDSSVSGGNANEARGTLSWVGGGVGNIASGYAASVGGGYYLTSGDDYQFVP